MPEFTLRKYNGKPIPYCTEEELLEFANKIRNAGGANIIEAFMPSVVGEPESCLIANALNFSCSVNPVHPHLPNGEFPAWHMMFPYRTTCDEVELIAETVGCKCPPGYWGGVIDDTIILPREIGNAAQAFDEGIGWTTKYAIPED